MLSSSLLQCAAWSVVIHQLIFADLAPFLFALAPFHVISLLTLLPLTAFVPQELAILMPDFSPKMAFYLELRIFHYFYGTCEKVRQIHLPPVQAFPLCAFQHCQLKNLPEHRSLPILHLMPQQFHHYPHSLHLLHKFLSCCILFWI